MPSRAHQSHGAHAGCIHAYSNIYMYLTYATVSVKLVLDGGLPYAHVLFSRDTLAKTSGVENQLFAARVCHELRPHRTRRSDHTALLTVDVQGGTYTLVAMQPWRSQCLYGHTPAERETTKE